MLPGLQSPDCLDPASNALLTPQCLWALSMSSHQNHAGSRGNFELWSSLFLSGMVLGGR